MTTNFPSQTPLILVVDDDRSLRTLLRVALEEEGYQVAEATNGEVGLAEFKHLLPDMVLLDAMMPVMDGFTCCSQLRTFPSAKHLPVLMITVLDDAESVDRAFLCGATDYITKPIHWAVLRQRVSRLLQGSQARQKIGQFSELLDKQTQRECLFRDITRRLSQSFTLSEMGSEIRLEIFEVFMAEIRDFFQVDRVLLHHKNDAWSISDSIFFEEYTGKYSLVNSGFDYEKIIDWQNFKLMILPDIFQDETSESISQHYEQMNVRAALVAPVCIQGEFWGLLEAHQSNSREWEAAEIELFADFAHLLSLGLGQL